MRPDLLILDDLGAERNTSYGKECVFDVVNRRLLSGKPMIITTNMVTVNLALRQSVKRRTTVSQFWLAS